MPPISFLLNFQENLPSRCCISRHFLMINFPFTYLIFPDKVCVCVGRGGAVGVDVKDRQLHQKSIEMLGRGWGRFQYRFEPVLYCVVTTTPESSRYSTGWWLPTMKSILLFCCFGALFMSSTSLLYLVFPFLNKN